MLCVLKGAKENRAMHHFTQKLSEAILLREIPIEIGIDIA